ncbi:MAG: BamA/TamA family outer membrane protein [Epsilonproteobacteria bacterium]|nr:BamA/TamA family outer membrane protein [Campylobacterota bacterium]
MRFTLIVLITLLPLSLWAADVKKLQFETKGKIKTSKLYDALGVQTPSWYQFWKDKTPKVPNQIITSLYESLGYFYRSEGYYHANIEKVETNSSITFHIIEGKPVRINTITIKSDEDIKPFISYKKGDRFQALEFSQIKKSIKEALLKRGYCNYNLDTKALVDIEKNSVDITYILQKNPPCRFGDITINSPKNIDSKIVKSRLTFQTGEKYSSEKINRSYSTISGLEAFDGIQLDMDKESDIVHVGINLKEKQKKSRIEAGVGYETNIGPRALFHWEKRNFAGDAKKVAFDLKYSAKEKLISNTVYWPAFFRVPKFDHYYLDLKNELAYSEIEFENFDELKYSNYLHLLKDYDWFSVDFGLGLELITIKKLKDVCNVSDGDFNLLFPFAKISLDLRDSKINPKNGLYLSQYLESGLTLLEDSSTYFTSITEARAIKTLNQFTLAARARVGLINVYSNALPESKLFFAGGAFSNRGYGYNSLGAFDADCDEVGAKTMIDTTLEVNHPLYQNFDGALFFDSTLLSTKSNRFSIDFVHSIGTGIRYISPIGPIKLDLGVDIDNTSQYALHFQIGQSF